MTRRILLALLTLVLAGGALTAQSTPAAGYATAQLSLPEAPPASRTVAQQPLQVGASAWVTVSVARLWTSPSAPWPVDAPALEAPVRFRAWLDAMTLTQRRNLDLRSDTEALLGDRVVVTRLRPKWAKVVVPSQPSQKDPRGYPGWVPRRQLTGSAPATTAEVATVLRRTAWLRSDDATAARRTEISFGTRLPVLGRVADYVRVLTPRGVARRIANSTVAVHARGAAARVPSRASVVRTAKSFLGLQYLWGGLSGFGLDCSGLTWLDYRAHGIRIPRDALPQSRHGQRVSKRLPGDLLFYANDGRVHHVTMDIGGGQIIHAPRTGKPVQVIGFSDQPLRSEYVGARRYLG